RHKRGITELLQAVDEVATGTYEPKPHRIQGTPPVLKNAVNQLMAQLEKLAPGLPNARWVALRLLDGDQTIADALSEGRLGTLASANTSQPAGSLVAAQL
ncbi:MAG: iron transporter FeoB, partial [Anaerolineae bacterium]|nr:iron transporter FeoB [Anaerolineae bacterium]